MRSRNRAESSTVPLPNTRFCGQPGEFLRGQGQHVDRVGDHHDDRARGDLDQLRDQRPADRDIGGREFQPGLAGLLLGPGGDRDHVRARADGTSSEPSDLGRRAEQQAVPQVQHLRLDLGGVLVVQHDVVGQPRINAA